ncbi:MAG: hypothetical protein K2X99_13300 [Gemmatimonadaceae bacterium]|nr:hypothetical protein [Gemmatimonadaceae bacterium]
MPKPAAERHDPLRETADALCRGSEECCHQHERLAHILSVACSDEELAGVAAVSDMCDAILVKQIAAYEQAASGGRGKAPEAWWHAANTLWHTAREYHRRHEQCNQTSTRLARHSAAKLGELTMEFELEASAVLGLRHAVGGYTKACS